jgi:hypothetical protein
MPVLLYGYSGGMCDQFFDVGVILFGSLDSGAKGSHELGKVCVLHYRTIILPVVLYGCETWLLTLREECRLRVFENRVLKRVFGPKSNEVTVEWRKLHNDS